METWRSSNEAVVIYRYTRTTLEPFTGRSSVVVTTTEEPEYVSATVQRLLKAKKAKPVRAPATAKKFMEWLDTK